MLDNRRCRFATITGAKLPSRSRGTSTATSPESVRFDDLFNHVCDPATLLMAFVIDRWYAALTPIWRAT
jgi:hypothetical protein